MSRAVTPCPEDVTSLSARERGRTLITPWRGAMLGPKAWEEQPTPQAKICLTNECCNYKLDNSDISTNNAIATTIMGKIDQLKAQK